MKRLLSRWMGAGCLAVILCGCVVDDFVGIKPISPTPTLLSGRCESLTPMLEWEDSDAEAKTYEVGIWRAHPGMVRGDRVYYRQGIVGCSHRVEQALQPDTAYFWSVRVTGSPNWSTINQKYYGYNSTTYSKGGFFPFSTPVAESTP